MPRPLSGPNPSITAAARWFQLSKYEGARHFTATEWAQQIARRLMIQAALASSDKVASDREMASLIENPTSPWIFTTNTQPLRALTMGDLLRLHELFEDALIKTEFAIDDLARGKHIGLDRRGHLVINLAMRDEYIRQSFEAWLAQRRELEAQEKSGASNTSTQRPRRINFDDWHASKVLPFFDLGLWSQWHASTTASRSLSDGDVAEILFPGDASTDRLRSIKRKVAEAFSFDVVNELIDSDRLDN